MIKIEQLLEESRNWKKLCSTMDGGSYCEDASTDFTKASEIRRLYEQLMDKLINYERCGYKLPS